MPAILSQDRDESIKIVKFLLFQRERQYDNTPISNTLTRYILKLQIINLKHDLEYLNGDASDIIVMEYYKKQLSDIERSDNVKEVKAC